jgi:hypothetical protein
MLAARNRIARQINRKRIAMRMKSVPPRTVDITALPDA